VEFRTGWFVESPAAQTLIIFAIRTRRVPFFRSRAGAVMTLTTFAVTAVGVVLNVSPLARTLAGRDFHCDRDAKRQQLGAGRRGGIDGSGRHRRRAGLAVVSTKVGGMGGVPLGTAHLPGAEVSDCARSDVPIVGR
jgi:hypothetical protein